MRLRSVFSLLALLVMVACQYTVPLSNSQDIAIDSSLLGNWTMLPEQDDPGASLDSMTVLRFSNSEYLLRYSSEGSEMFFRAYLIDVDGDKLLQMELLGGDEGPLTNDEDKHRYIVARYSLDGSTLAVSTLNTQLVSREINDTEELLKAYLENKDNPELFSDPGHFNRK